MADGVFALGDVAFGLTEACMERMRRSRSWRWPSAEVVDAAPRLSYTGPGEETLSLEGVVFPGQLGDEDALDRLVELANEGKPHPFVASDGRAFGRWVIESIEEDQGNFLPGGRARRIGWTMTLKRYPDDAS